MSNGVIDTSQAFAGIKNAAVSSGRLPRPALGKGWYLLTKAELKASQKGGTLFVPFTYKCVLPICDAEGRPPETEGYVGERAGSKVSPQPFYAGPYFAEKMKRFTLTVLGLDETNCDDMVAGTVADMKASADSGAFIVNPNDDDIGNTWKYINDNICGNLVGAQCGCFDNGVVIELHTVRSVKENTEGTGKMVNGVFVADPAKEYDNTYTERRVSFTEVQNALAGKPEVIAQVFDSAEKLQSLVDSVG